MAKTSPSSNRTKAADKGGIVTHKPARKAAVKPSKELAPKAEQAMAARILQDVREGAHELSKRADRLLRRVS